MHSGFTKTPINSKKDLLILRIFSSLQFFVFSFVIFEIFILPLGLTMLGDAIYETLKNDINSYMLVCGGISLLLTIFVVWIFKWYPIIDREDELKLK